MKGGIMRAIATPRRGKRLIAAWLSTLWIAAGWLAATSVRADIYFWEDSSGVIHFSNQDAPPEAALYMRETAAPVNPESDEAKDENGNDKLTREIARQQASTQQRLEAANRKLSHALERVDDLTQAVARSRAQAQAAAEAARQSELEADAANRNRSDVQERVVVHVVHSRHYEPYRHPYEDHRYKKRRHNFKNRHSRHPNHKNRFRPHSHGNHYNIEKTRHRRHKAFNYHIPRPILPPEPTRIPRAYGIR
jgi:hypothetical protein